MRSNQFNPNELGYERVRPNDWLVRVLQRLCLSVDVCACFLLLVLSAAFPWQLLLDRRAV